MGVGTEGVTLLGCKYKLNYCKSFIYICVYCKSILWADISKISAGTGQLPWGRWQVSFFDEINSKFNVNFKYLFQHEAGNAALWIFPLPALPVSSFGGFLIRKTCEKQLLKTQLILVFRGDAAALCRTCCSVWLLRCGWLWWHTLPLEYVMV